jgi:hypothetical protein
MRNLYDAFKADLAIQEEKIQEAADKRIAEEAMVNKQKYEYVIKEQLAMIEELRQEIETNRWLNKDNDDTHGVEQMDDF